MKDILSLKRAITETDYCENMFSKWGTEKNILFVSPQLSGKHLYKSILPFLCLPDKTEQGQIRIATGITSLKPFDYRKQLIEYEIELTDKHIMWADFIVFPFTTQPLSQDVYKKIRALNPRTKILYSVDFNFYELSESHPYKNIFSDEMILSQVEDNMYFSDAVVVDNLLLVQYIFTKFKKLMEGKYDGVQGYMSLTCLPTMIDSEIVLKNVDYYEPENAQFIKTETIHTPAINELIDEAAKAEQKLKEEFLQKKEVESKSEKNSTDKVVKKITKAKVEKVIVEAPVKEVKPVKKSPKKIKSVSEKTTKVKTKKTLNGKRK